jgi:uncharacterized membrane protein YjjP (DUF1212 family)
MSAIHSSGGLTERARFLRMLATRLHQYGTAAPRLESAVTAVADRIGVRCDVWSNPTGILLSFRDPARGDDVLSESTQVIRLEPGDNDLRRLSEVDHVAERVRRGELGIDEGYRLLRAMEPRGELRVRLLAALGYGLASGTVAVLLKTSWTDVGVATVIGLLIGLISLQAATHLQLRAGFEAIAALVAALAVSLISATLMPLAVNSVLISSLIVLVPGLMLTTAVNELANQHLVSGMSRFAGAGAILLKLAFGTAAGLELARVLGVPADSTRPVAVPAWAEWLALAVGSFNFALLFKAAARDVPLVMASVWLGYLTTRFAGASYGAEFGAFLAGLVVGSIANLYARLARRPGALVRVPGIILLVPGSVGFRSLFFVFEGDVARGIDTAVSLLVLLISLVAGLLFANILVTPRKTLS